MATRDHWLARLNGPSWSTSRLAGIGGGVVALLLLTFFVVVHDATQRAHAARQQRHLEATRSANCGLLPDRQSQALCRVTLPLASNDAAAVAAHD